MYKIKAENFQIKNISNYSSTKDVNFILTEGDEFRCDLTTLKLHSYLYTSNMVMFDETNKITKYDTVDRILDNFCKVRFDYYIKRKQYQLNYMKADMKYLGNKQRFVQEVISEELLIMNKTEKYILEQLKTRGYDEDPKKIDNEGGYEYLLRMQIRTFTADKVKQIKNDIASIQQKIDGLTRTTEKEIWLGELEEFEKAYNTWLFSIEKEEVKTKARRAKKNK